MFFKKKEQLMNSADHWYYPRWQDMEDAYYRLKECVRQAIIKTQVVDLYPEGADKVHAIATADQARVALRDAIANYDTCRQELIQWYKVNACGLSVYASFKATNWPDSHTCIENAYEEFFKNP